MNPQFEQLVERAHLTQSDLSEMRRAIELDYPSDPMMQDIRLVRSLHALADEKVTLSELLQEMDADRTSHLGK